jgi:hypothetical protein
VSKLIFKLRSYNPANYQQGKKNAAHIRYIATRPGVSYNEGARHGLFGKFGEMPEAANIVSLKNAVNYIREKSARKTNMYRAVISFKAEDAAMLGLTERAEWEKLIKAKIGCIASEIGIKAQNLEWCAAVHNDRGHPHLHAVFWDKNQQIKDYFVPPEKAGGIRKQLLKDIFAEQLNEVYAEKEEIKREIGQSPFFGEFENFLNNMDGKEFSRVKQGLTANDRALAPRKIQGKTAESFLIDVFGDLLKLSESMPKSGRLSYGFMPSETKAEIDALVLKIMAGNKDLSRAIGKYLDNAVKIAEFYASNPETLKQAEEKAREDIMKKLGNKVLAAVKGIKEREREIQTAEHKRDMSFTLVQEIFFMLSQYEQQNSARLNVLQNGELSKQAKVETAKRMESKGLDWD